MTHINQRRDYSVNWTSANPILQRGEVGWEEDTLKAKLGDGSTPWNGLAYAIYPGTKESVGLGNVDNTSDANKPVSIATQVALDLKAPLASPAFTGNPTAPTPAEGDDDTSIATTAFVKTALLPKAPLASPAFTGTPTAPTPASGDSSTTLATTAFVKNVLTPKAPLLSPMFTGNPTAPTPALGDNDLSLATTEFVQAALGDAHSVQTALASETNWTWSDVKIAHREAMGLVTFEASLTYSGATTLSSGTSGNIADTPVSAAGAFPTPFLPITPVNRVDDLLGTISGVSSWFFRLNSDGSIMLTHGQPNNDIVTGRVFTFRAAWFLR